MFPSIYSLQTSHTAVALGKGQALHKDREHLSRPCPRSLQRPHVLVQQCSGIDIGAPHRKDCTALWGFCSKPHPFESSPPSTFDVFAFGVNAATLYQGDS